MTEDKVPAVETFEDRVNKQMRKEMEEANRDWVRAQKLTDYLWQQKLDAEAPFVDDHVEIVGFRERRTRYGFTKHWRDLDFDTRWLRVHRVDRKRLGAIEQRFGANCHDFRHQLVP